MDDSRPILLKGKLDLPYLSSKFSYAMVQHNPTNKATRIESLVDSDNYSKTLNCPRDNIDGYIIVEGKVATGWDCCNFCMYMIDCHVTGLTKKFILASKAKPEE